MKTQILKKLKASESYLSGQVLADEMNVTRTAVWKMIKQLQQDGYLIKAVPNKGYFLSSDSDLLSKEELSAMIDESWLNRSVEFFSEVDSTNTRAKLLAEQGADEGVLVVADLQTAGKGRQGRSWISSKGLGIWMSLILRPSLNPLSASALTLVTALAVCRAIEITTDLKPQIKWPNDIVIKGKKVCGILTEMSSEIDHLNYLVIGIGINVNHVKFPKELEEIATSCCLESGKTVMRRDLIAAIMKEMNNYYYIFLESGDLTSFLEDYQLRLVNKDNQVEVISGSGSYQGIARGITKRGELLVHMENGEVRNVSSGEVSVRGIYGYV